MQLTLWTAMFWRSKIINCISTYFITKLNLSFYKHGVQKVKKTLISVENLTCTVFCFHNLLFLQCFSLAGSKYLSPPILCNGPGLWNIILKAPGILDPSNLCSKIKWILQQVFVNSIVIISMLSRLLFFGVYNCTVT